jgi:hypothetical protein
LEGRVGRVGSVIWSVAWSEFLKSIKPKKAYQNEKIKPENVKIVVREC